MTVAEFPGRSADAASRRVTDAHSDTGSDMGSRASGTVIKSFRSNVERIFDPTVESLRLDGPEHQDNVMPSVSFFGSGLRYRVFLDISDMTVLTGVEVEADAVKLVAEVGAVASAAGITSPVHYSQSARTLHDLDKSLTSHARLIELIHPIATTESAPTIMRRANARKWKLS